MSSTPAPLIVSLKFDDRTFEVLNDLRRQYFPPARNVVPAHITLFHALPGVYQELITTRLHGHCATTPVLPLIFSGVRSLGRGVAIDVECPGLNRLRQHLATAWRELLGAQDRQPYRPHVTIQNKVTPSEAQGVYERLSATWSPLGGQGRRVGRVALHGWAVGTGGRVRIYRKLVPTALSQKQIERQLHSGTLRAIRSSTAPVLL